MHQVGKVDMEHRVTKLVKWLPAGPTATGGHREHTLVQFIGQKGGVRTVRVDQLVPL